MAVVIEEVIGEVRSEPVAADNQEQTANIRTPRPDVAADLRRLAVRAARVHAD
ncbi:MAG: hypothetical protein OEY86_02420 [Nitrospira sp.]|nr:hypothetical protein [Nitrospira sp.]